MHILVRALQPAIYAFFIMNIVIGVLHYTLTHDIQHLAISAMITLALLAAMWISPYIGHHFRPKKN